MVKVRSIIDYFAVIVFVLGTGSLYFQVLHMPLLAIIMLAMVICMIWHRKHLLKKNLLIFLAITIFYLFNSMINHSNGFYLNDLIIWVVNGIFVLVLASNLSFEQFKRQYVIIMVFEAAISLLCFLVGDVLGQSNILPFLTTASNSGNGYYLTPYYTLGWFNIPVFHRNAGIYWEPGAHQIFLNLALFFVLNDKEKAGLTIRKYRLSIVLLLAAVMTTLSTTGYLCLAVVLFSILFRNERYKGKWKLQAMMLIVLATLIIFETYTGVVTTKLEDFASGNGTGVTRYNDSYYGYLLGLDNPLFGQGIFATTVTDLLHSYGVMNISNGMALYALRIGIIPTVTLLFVMFIGIRKKMPYGNMNNFLFLVFVLMCVNTASVFMNVFMLAFIFTWKNEKVVRLLR